MGDTTGFYADEGVEHVWQDSIKLGGSMNAYLADVYDCDRFGDCTKVVYEIMDGSRLIAFCEFDGGNIARGKSLGTWKCSLMSQVPFKGKFASEEDVPKILKDVAKKLPKFIATMQQSLIKSIRVPPGWEIDEGSDLESDLAITRHLPKSQDYVLIATFWNVAGVAEGDKDSYNLSFNDYGGYERSIFFEDEGTYKSLDDIPRILKAFDSRVEKWMKNRESGASVKGKTMDRSTAKTLTEKALRQAEAAAPRDQVQAAYKKIMNLVASEVNWGVITDKQHSEISKALKRILL